MSTIPSREPLSFAAGDTTSWTKSLSDYPASAGWVLSYAIRGPQVINLTATASGNDHLITISAATSANYTAGDYWWQSYVTKGSERFPVGDGTVKILPNLATASGTYDGRSHVKKVLDALEATILGKASLDQLSYSIQGRSLSRLNPEELIKWRDVYKREYQKEVKEERIRRGLSSKTLIKTRFN